MCSTISAEARLEALAERVRQNDIACGRLDATALRRLEPNVGLSIRRAASMSATPRRLPPPRRCRSAR